jgi:hypothetical protein
MPTSQKTHYSEPISCRCLYHSSEDVSSQIPWHNPFTDDRIHERQHSRHNSEPISPTTPLFSFSHNSQIPWRGSFSQDSHNHSLPIVSPFFRSLPVISLNLDLDLLSQNSPRHTSPPLLADFAGRSQTSPNSSKLRKKEAEIV